MDISKNSTINGECRLRGDAIGSNVMKTKQLLLLSTAALGFALSGGAYADSTVTCKATNNNGTTSCDGLTSWNPNSDTENLTKYIQCKNNDGDRYAPNSVTLKCANDSLGVYSTGSGTVNGALAFKFELSNDSSQQVKLTPTAVCAQSEEDATASTSVTITTCMEYDTVSNDYE